VTYKMLGVEELTVHPLSAELKDSLVAKMLPPHNVGVPQVVRETGIPRDTLYGWRRQAAGQGAAAAAPATPLETWSSAEKFAAVIETASLNELELGEYCRCKGLFPEQLAAWHETCRQANAALPSGHSGVPSASRSSA
jgi:transposase